MMSSCEVLLAFLQNPFIDRNVQTANVHSLDVELIGSVVCNMFNVM